MAQPVPKMTRRGFLQASAFGVGALFYADQFLQSLAGGLMKLGVSAPWYRKGQVKTTYNYCDICPWKNLDKLPSDKAAPIVVYCGVGQRGAIAMTILQMLGYTNVKNLVGGLTAWKAANLPVV